MSNIFYNFVIALSMPPPHYSNNLNKNREPLKVPAAMGRDFTVSSGFKVTPLQRGPRAARTPPLARSAPQQPSIQTHWPCR